ncbi:hypothetical protein CLOP_g24489 [Closterium sp. NIES-67]|nr:hypothetical protein CLOP_g24489 [Closterium sp. NIES-67]
MAVGRREGRKGEDKEEEEEPTQADDDGERGRREEGAGDVRVDGIAGKAGSPQQQEQGGQKREGEQGEGQGSRAGLTHGLELGDSEMHRGGVEQGGKEREGGRREGGREEGVGEREGVPLSLEAQVKALQKQQAEVQSWEEEVIRRIGAVETREREAKRREKVIDGKETEIAWREKEWRKEAELRRVGSEGEDEGVGLGRRVGAAGGGVSGGMRHDVMEALQMLKLTVKALEDNIEMVLNTEAGLHPHAFNASVAFLQLPPGSVEIPAHTHSHPRETAAPVAAAPAAAAAAEAGAEAAALQLSAGEAAAAATAPKAPDRPKQYIRPRVQGPLVIAGMVYNRVFDGDYTRFWALHVWQWLEYHRYAGVTRFYWYDEARSTEEDQDVVLAPYVDAGLLVYHRVRELPFVEGNFTAYLERMFRCKQGAAFNHWVKQYASEVHWAFHVDIDEYFFSPAGTPPGFLRHYLQTLPNTTIQVLVQNLFFLGDPIGPDTDTLLERYTLRMPNSSERHRTKPLAWLPLAAHLTDDCINPHSWPVMENGPPPLVDTRVMRLNHYWGDRAGVISDNTPIYTMDVTMMDEYGDGLVKDESAKPMGAWLRQRMQVAWAVISAQAVRKERVRLRKHVAEVKTRVKQLVALVPKLLKRGGGEGVGRGEGGEGGEESGGVGVLEVGGSVEVSGFAGDDGMGGGGGGEGGGEDGDGGGDGDGDGDMMLGGGLMMGDFFFADLLNATNAANATNATAGANVTRSADVTIGASVTTGASVTAGADGTITSNASTRAAGNDSLPAAARTGAVVGIETPQKPPVAPVARVALVTSREEPSRMEVRLGDSAALVDRDAAAGFPADNTAAAAARAGAGGVAAGVSGVSEGRDTGGGIAAGVSGASEGRDTGGGIAAGVSGVSEGRDTGGGIAAVDAARDQTGAGSSSTAAAGAGADAGKVAAGVSGGRGGEIQGRHISS